MRSKYASVVKAAFEADVKDHTMSVELDQGIHRSLLFSNRGSSIYHFRLTTWQKHLAITGDMGDFVFCRLEDMFEFFRGKSIQDTYWAEKCVAGVYEEFNADHWTELLENLLEQETITTETHDELLFSPHETFADACSSLEEYDVSDAGEYAQNMYSHTHHFLWCLRAITWGIAQYDKAKE